MNEEALRLGNRHLARTDDSPPIQPFEAAVVCIRCETRIAGTVAGQHTLWMLTNLLARQFAVISELQIDVPNVPLLPNIAVFGQCDELKATLLNTASMIVGSAMTVSGLHDGRAKLCIHVGKAETDAGISVIGDGWKAFVGKPRCAPDFIPNRTESAGPYFAACLGAGHVFTELTLVNAHRKRRAPERFVVSLWSLDQGNDWDAVEQGPRVEAWNIKPFYLIGAGAVGQAMMLTLRTTPGVAGICVPIDFDPIDGPNLNRYPLATQDSINGSKPKLVAELCSTEQFCCIPYDGKWEEYVFDQKRPKIAQLEQDERAWRFELVLSCVDKNPARHAIQNFWPRLLLGGSTHGMSLQAMAYDMTTDGECLKCSNPIANETTIEQNIERWKAMSGEERRRTAETLNLDLAAIERFLADPRCGELGEQEIGKYRLRRGQQWSVGFVSVACGVLLATRLFRFCRDGISSAFPKNAARFNFVNPQFVFTRHLRRPDCDCSKAGRSNFARAWNGTQPKKI